MSDLGDNCCETRAPLWVTVLIAVFMFVGGMIVQSERQLANECEDRTCPGGETRMMAGVCSCITPAPLKAKL